MNIKTLFVAPLLIPHNPVGAFGGSSVPRPLAPPQPRLALTGQTQFLPLPQSGPRLVGHSPVSMRIAALTNSEMVPAPEPGPKASETGQVHRAHDLADVVYSGYNQGQRGPISIAPALLTDQGKARSVQLVTLSGTEFVGGQSTGLMTDLKACFNLDNDYKNNAKQTVLRNVEPGATLVLTGHSLGGMVAQQLAADPDLKERYTIAHTVTFGSPLLSAGKREGNVHRLNDDRDPVSNLSAESLIFPGWNQKGQLRESSSHPGVMGAHIDSYTDPEVWGDRDVLGRKGGNAKLTFIPDQRQFFPAPSKPYMASNPVRSHE